MATVLTANINSTSIKICEINHSAKATVIEKAFKLKTPEGTVDDGRILDVDKLASFLSTELTWRTVTTKEIIFIVNSSKIPVKEVYTPVLRAGKLKDMIQANASEYFPVNIDEYIVTHKVVCQGVSETGSKQLKVNVMAAPRDLIEGYYSLAEKLGMIVKNVEHHSNATVSILKKHIGPETSVVIQVHDDYTTVNVFKNNVLELQRNVPYGKNVVVQALMKELRMDEDAAEAIISKERLIHSSFDGDQVTESLRYLINSIERVVDYYTSRNSDSSVEKAYLTGESVNMLGLENLFANEFDFSVMQIMEFREVTISPNLVLEPKYISAYLACAGAVLDPVDFQLIREEGKVKTDKSVKYLLIATGVALLVGIVLIAIPGIQNLSLKSDIEDMDEKINEIKDIEVVVDSYYKAKDMYTDAALFQSASSDPNDYLLDFLYALEKGQPSDISIKSMSVASGQVSISATTSTKQSIAKLIVQLNTMPGVSGVFVSNTSESKDEYGIVTSSFSVSFMFNSLIEQYIAEDTVEEETSAESETTAEGEVQ